MSKTISFAVMHFAIAFTVAYLLTGDIVVGGVVALVEPAVNTVGFYFHERFWRNLETWREAQRGKKVALPSSPEVGRFSPSEGAA